MRRILRTVYVPQELIFGGDFPPSLLAKVVNLLNAIEPSAGHANASVFGLHRTGAPAAVSAAMLTLDRFVADRLARLKV